MKPLTALKTMKVVLSLLSFGSFFYQKGFQDLVEIQQEFTKYTYVLSDRTLLQQGAKKLYFSVEQLLKCRTSEASYKLSTLVEKGKPVPFLRKFYEQFNTSFPLDFSCFYDPLFYVGSQGVDLVQHLRKNNREASAYSFFDYITSTVTYDKKKGYRSALEVLEEKKGCCLDQSVLFMSFARLDGLDAWMYDVVVDSANKKLSDFNESHCCAGVTLDHRLILVDPAWKQFDVSHKKIEKKEDTWIKQWYLGRF